MVPVGYAREFISEHITWFDRTMRIEVDLTTRTDDHAMAVTPPFGEPCVSPPVQRSPGANGESAVRHLVTLGGYEVPPRTSMAMSATCVGVRPTRMPLASRASIFAAALPLEPETM